MGCGANGNKVSQPQTSNVKLENPSVQLQKPSSSDVGKGVDLDALRLKDFNMIWFDPNIFGADNNANRLCLEQLSLFSNNPPYYADTPEKAREFINISDKPIVFVSCGGAFEQVRELAAKQPYVVATIIFCWRLEYHISKKGKDKVLDVTNTFTSMIKTLQKVHAEYVRFLRFFEPKCENTFYYPKDKAIIINSMCVESLGDKFSVFYPLGIKTVDFGKKLDDGELNTIEKAVLSNPRLGELDKDNIRQVVEFLRKNRSIEGVLRAYTMEGLYRIINSYLKTGDREQIKVFRNYLFCLKGAMCEMGEPVYKEGSKIVVYRGLNMPEGMINEYKGNIGGKVLSSAFMTTTLNQKKAMTFAREGQQAGATILQINLVDFNQEFADFVAQFEFPEENGVYFPISIAKFSQEKDEEEVLFPPFYPLKIIEVKVDSYCYITAEAPYYVNMAGKSAISNMYKEMPRNADDAKEYLNSLIKLVRQKLIDKISVVKLPLLGSLPAFVDALKGVKNLQRLIVEYESIKDEHAALMAKEGVLGCKALTYLSLANNKITDVGAMQLAGSLSKTSLLTLELYHNKLKDKGIAAMCGFLRGNTALIYLGLKKNGITDAGIKQLAGAVSEKLQVLDLARNKFGDAGAGDLAGMLESNKALRSLDLEQNMITSAGGKKIFLALKGNKTLRTLVMSYNKLDGTMGDALFAVLSENSSLETLGLRYNKLGEDGGRKLGDALKANNGLTSLDISGNSMGDAAGESIAGAMAAGHGKKLTLLNIGFNNIKKDVVHKLVEAVAKNEALKTLDLSGLQISEADQKTLGKRIVK